MRRSETTTLGIDLNEREIRVVHVGTKNGRPFVIEAVAAALPWGAISHGIVMEPSTLAVALRRVLDSMRSTGSAKAAIGVSGTQTHFRALSIPPCPDDELPALVTGEMEHQGLWRNDGSPHDFFSLHPPTAAPEEMRSIAVVSVDASIAQSLCDVAESVGVGVAALEPTPLAMLRTAAATLRPAATAFFLLVGPLTTDAAFFVGGRLAAFRRLEVGTEAMIQSMAPSPSLEDPTSLAGGPPITMFGLGLDSGASGGATDGWSHFDHAAVDRLAIEAQRTMEYVQRFDRAGSKIDDIGIVGDDADVEPLAEMLERRFGLPTRLVRLPDGVPDPRFAAAYGLATHAAISPVEMPRVDLFSNHRAEAKREETKRNFKGSILVSGAGILVGLVGCVLYNRQIAQVVRQSKDEAAQIAELKAKTSAVLDARADEEARYKRLRKEGVPLGPIMDYVVASLDSGVTLKTVAVGDDLKVRVEGEARDEAALVRTTQGLQANPILSGVALDQFTRAKEVGGLLSFQVSGATVAADRVKPAVEGS